MKTLTPKTPLDFITSSILVASFFLFAQPSYAQIQEPTPVPQPQTPNTIEELNLGSCWMQPMKPDQQTIGYRVVSFGSGTAFTLLTDEAAGPGGGMKDWIQTQLKTRFATLPALKYEVGFHCFSSGHLVTIQIDRPDQQPICINAKGKASNSINDLELIALRPESSFLAGATCYGIEEKSLGLSLKTSDEASVASIRSTIDSIPTLKEMVEKIDYKPGSFFAMVVLKDAYSFREVEAQTALKNNADIMNQVSAVWLNSINVISGEDRVFFQGQTDAY